MKYTSTRSNAEVNSAQAIVEGLSASGGLYIPTEIPKLEMKKYSSYNECAVDIISKFLTDFTHDELKESALKAYNTDRFDNPEIAPLHELDDRTSLIELWHGPTCAFKDMALQLLPHLMGIAAKKVGEKRELLILTATSGDTGKAALEAFRDVDGTRCIVIYPSEGVSDIQKLQMTTQEGGNVWVCGIRGNFDQAQTAVKELFTDKIAAEKLNEANTVFSSANSINWGRLVPQIAYYVYAYQKTAKDGEAVNIAVPTGNFGNILAAYYAKRMGLPVNRLICASNINNVLTDFINTGVYDRNRTFYTTISPSMDILISSNLERLLCHLTDKDSNIKLMQSLRETGVFKLSGDALTELKSLFYGGYCDDEQTKAVINMTYKKYNYLCDTHTAVGLGTLQKYRKETGDNTKTLVASTASPFKFPSDVLNALDPKVKTGNSLERLAEYTKIKPPKPLENLGKKPILMGDICGIDEIKGKIIERI